MHHIIRCIILWIHVHQAVIFCAEVMILLVSVDFDDIFNK